MNVESNRREPKGPTAGESTRVPSPAAPFRDIPEELGARMRAFQESRVILTALELDVWSAVGSGATAEEIAKKIGASPRGTRPLLDALCAIGLLGKDPASRDPESGARYRNLATTAQFLAAGGANDLRLALHHMINLWGRWSMLTECVRAGTSVPPPPEFRGSPADMTATFIAAMDRGARIRAGALARAAGAERVSRMLDVGGGSGGYSIAFAQANPKLHAVVFDLPEVVPLTERYVAAAGLSDRVTTRAGDMLEDEFGRAGARPDGAGGTDKRTETSTAGYDLVLLSQICHMFDSGDNRALIRKCGAVLSPGGRLVIQDFILEPDRTHPRPAALFALNMLVATPAGSTYTAAEYEEWMREAGLDEIERIDLQETGIMIGRRQG
jgi:SAM-dependent methyltransferase